MASVVLDNVGVEIPIYGIGAHSLKQTFLRKAAGGAFGNAGSVVTVKALSNINLELSDGDSVGLIGHNGAGKTSLLRTIAGVYPPTQGEVRTSGRISPIFDISLGMSIDATGIENIRICGALWGLAKNEIEDGIADIAAFSELGDYLEVPVRTYSAGMLLRLSFAIATLRQPEILLVDEIIGVGDVSFMEKAQQRLMKIVKGSHILVVSSHSGEIISQLCNQVIWLEQGSVVMHGPAQEVLSAYYEASGYPNALVGNVSATESPEMQPEIAE